jgi:preprotein translocase subunit SecA
VTTVPSTIWRTLAHGAGSEPLPKGMDSIWDWAMGKAGRALPRRRMLLRRADRVLGLEKDYKDLTDARLRERIDELRETFLRGRETRRQVDHAFAMVREVAARQIGLRAYRVQVAGALALEGGCIAELATGEGKTLSGTMPATIFGWRGKGCHVVTHNDYLARRDAEEMEPVYKFCGLRVASIDGEMDPPDRRDAYGADITYCTNKEVCADFLRDRLILGRMRGLSSVLLGKIAEGGGAELDRLVMRGLHYALVDEADSLLIDEAVTPLIISGDAPNEEQVEAYVQAADAARELVRGKHYKVSERYREVELTSEGKREAARLTEAHGGLFAGSRRREELITQALNAKHFFVNGQQYVVQDGEVVIVDEFTGRLMPDRNWRDGLHQAVESKEQLEVNPPKDTYARLSFQRFFRLYRRLGGMTGTASEATPEFWQIYHLPVVVVPTNRPCIRKHGPDRVFTSEQAKWNAIVGEIDELHRSGRPILVGTRSVRNSEMLSEMLTQRGLPHEVLNAVRHAEEAQITAQAGQMGRITVSTNMAGRGTDIKLGRGVAELGGLHVLATERHEAGRIDRQLYGRAGRQGDPGSAQAFVSLEDELVRRYTPHMARIVRRRYGSDREITGGGNSRLFDHAQRRAEAMALRQRKGVLKTDDWLDEYLGFAGSEQ